MCVANDGVKRAGEPELELDLVAELRHRDARLDARRDSLHRLLDRPARTPHRVELLGRLDAAKQVDERRPGPEPVEAERPAEVERRLCPDPVAHGDRGGRPEALRHALEDGGAVVGLVHDDDLALRAHRKVEHDDHARQHEDRVGVRPEEAARDPSVRVGALPEERDPALDAREVLEVGREPEEEEVDPLRAHPLGEAASPLGVVEHASILRKPMRRSLRRARTGCGEEAPIRNACDNGEDGRRAQAPAAGRLPPVGVRRRGRRGRRARRAVGRLARHLLVVGVRGCARRDVRGERAVPPLPVEERARSACGRGGSTTR